MDNLIATSPPWFCDIVAGIRESGAIIIGMARDGGRLILNFQHGDGAPCQSFWEDDWNPDVQAEVVRCATLAYQAHLQTITERLFYATTLGLPYEVKNDPPLSNDDGGGRVLHCEPDSPRLH